MARRLQKLKAVVEAFKVTGKYVMDPEVSTMKKMLLLFPLIYIVSPVDLISDFAPILGWADDTAIALIVWNYLAGSIQKYKQKKEIEEEEEETGSDYTLNEDEYDVE